MVAFLQLAKPMRLACRIAFLTLAACGTRTELDADHFPADAAASDVTIETGPPPSCPNCDPQAEYCLYGVAPPLGNLGTCKPLPSACHDCSCLPLPDAGCTVIEPDGWTLQAWSCFEGRPLHVACGLP